MQPVCRLRLAPARLPQPEVPPRAHGGTATTCQPRRSTTSSGCAWCVCVAPAPRLRARAPCGGGTTEPVETRKDGLAPAVDQADQEAGLLAPEELEVLEEAAITGDDEGRRPTDYDRRAHIFEESSRVFRELKERSDGGGSESGRGGVTTTGATAAETRACDEQQQ